jgi:transposase
MRKIRDVFVCIFEKKFKQRATARCTGLSRTAIADCLTRFAAAGLSWPLPSEIDDEKLENLLFPVKPVSISKRVEIDFSIVHEERKQKGATLSVLYDEWCQNINPLDTISYSQYCRRYSDFKESLRISLRQIYIYGELALVDYAGPTMPVRDPKTGEQKTAQLFIGVLGGSNYTFCEATWSQQSQDWQASHIRMFEFFGGVPEIVVHDNLKSAVTKANRFAPLMNESYANLCRYYGTQPFAARAYRPRDKAKAESTVLLVERWIIFRLRKRQFFSLPELNAAIRELLQKLNHKAFQKLSGSRFSRWIENEKTALQSLPLESYEIAEYGKVRAGLDYCISLDGNYYSVPNHLRTQEFDYRLTTSTIDLFRKGKLVTSHQRCFEKGGVYIHPQHRTPAHAAVASWSYEESLAWAADIGPNTHTMLTAQLARINNGMFGYRILAAMKSIHKKCGSQRLEEACAYGVKNKVTNTDQIRRVITNNLDRILNASDNQTEIIGIAEQANHENIRGADYYQHILNLEKEEGAL